MKIYSIPTSFASVQAFLDQATGWTRIEGSESSPRVGFAITDGVNTVWCYPSGDTSPIFVSLEFFGRGNIDSLVNTFSATLDKDDTV